VAAIWLQEARSPCLSELVEMIRCLAISYGAAFVKEGESGKLAVVFLFREELLIAIDRWTLKPSRQPVQRA